MPDTFTWLHFSDLHWGSEEIKNRWSNVKEDLFADITELKRTNNLKIDAPFLPATWSTGAVSSLP